VLEQRFAHEARVAGRIAFGHPAVIDQRDVGVGPVEAMRRQVFEKRTRARAAGDGERRAARTGAGRGCKSGERRM
jgi:hypothetical protein